MFVMLMVTYFINAIDMQQQVPATSTKVPTVIIPDRGVSECQHDKDVQGARHVIHGFVQNYIGMYLKCGPGDWQRVFYFDASSTDCKESTCPCGLNEASAGGCIGVSLECVSAFIPVPISYTKVCGRLIGNSTSTPDAFYRFLRDQITIEGNYLDGVSITHGAAGSRNHIWTYGVGHPKAGTLPFARCPCDSTNKTIAPTPPVEVGDNYFCVRSDGDDLWTGEGCSDSDPCCSFHNPPYFIVQLSEATTDRIELRICNDQGHADESVAILFAELYVQ